jgi:tRNA (mo5U34)-methyltransferase
MKTKTLSSREEIEREVERLGPWFHNIDLLGVQTAPGHFLGDYPSLKWRNFERALPVDLSGKSVLDIGCNGGFYSIEMKKRGAARVVGIDHDEQYLRQARFAARILDFDIEFRKLSVYKVAELREQYDLVLFMGVFYHLRHPLLALDLLYEHVAKDLLVFQSLQRGSDEVERLEQDYPFTEQAIFNQPGYPKLHFVEDRYSNDPTNWWFPNLACSEALLRSAGFHIFGHPEAEVFICRRGERPDWCGAERIVDVKVGDVEVAG